MLRCCYRCPRKTIGCHASCTEYAAEKLVIDLLKIPIQREKAAAKAADNVAITRWEKNHRRKTRMM